MTLAKWQSIQRQFGIICLAANTEKINLKWLNRILSPVNFKLGTYLYAVKYVEKTEKRKRGREWKILLKFFDGKSCDQMSLGR